MTFSEAMATFEGLGGHSVLKRELELSLSTAPIEFGDDRWDLNTLSREPHAKRHHARFALKHQGFKALAKLYVLYELLRDRKGVSALGYAHLRSSLSRPGPPKYPYHTPLRNTLLRRRRFNERSRSRRQHAPPVQKYFEPVCLLVNAEPLAHHPLQSSSVRGPWCQLTRQTLPPLVLAYSPTSWHCDSAGYFCSRPRDGERVHRQACYRY